MSEQNCVTIAEFCVRQGIAQSTYFALAREGRGPRVMRVGSRGVRISPEAEANWRREREAEAAKEVTREAA